MLSPASHRVCCLAVMAPALTKGDSRNDCLPVELSEPYCVTEAASATGKYGGIRVHTYLLKRKQYMNRTWFRNSLLKNCSSEPHDLRKSLLSNSKFRIYAEPSKSKSWHAASATLAVADKVKSKYIMIKANGSNKNMGLVRGNTALALQTIKKMSSNRENSPIKASETPTHSPDLPDTTNSELDVNSQPSTRTIHSTQEPSNEEVSSSCGDLVHICSELDILSAKRCTLVSLQDGPSVFPREDNLIVSSVNNTLKNSTNNLSSNHIDPLLVEGGAVPHNGNEDCEEDSPPTNNCTNSHPVLIPSSSVHNSHTATERTHSEWPTAVHSPVTECASDSECDVAPSSPISQSDVETASASCSISSSSTLSANISDSLDHPVEEQLPAPAGLTFPDEFLGTVPRSATVPASAEELCCPLPAEDLLQLHARLHRQEVRLDEGLRQAEVLFRRHLVPHVQLQLATAAAVLRGQHGVPCQRRSSQPGCARDPLAAALAHYSSEVGWPPMDDRDLCETRHSLQRKLRSLLVTVDPDLTDESSEEEDSDVEELTDMDGPALWSYLCERASLTRRSTWLLARIHELENHARQLRRQPSHPPLQLGAGEGACRLRPLLSPRYRRPLLGVVGAHHQGGRLARPSQLACGCRCADDRMPCVLCTGRYHCGQGVDPEAAPLRDRVALLHPDYHPLLSQDQDIPLLLHFESLFKKNEDQYQKAPPVSPISNSEQTLFGTNDEYPESRSHRKLNKYARSYFSKYRNKKHFQKHNLVFGKWRKLQNKNSFHARIRSRRYSVPSSESSIEDSPVSSPLSPSEDGFFYDGKRRRDESQFDIDDIIMPIGSKGGRVQKYEVKDIEIPSWRSINIDDEKASEVEENTSDEEYVNRHESYEAEERRIIRSGGDTLRFFKTWEQRTANLPGGSLSQSIFCRGPQEGEAFEEDEVRNVEEEGQEDLQLADDTGEAVRSGSKRTHPWADPSEDVEGYSEDSKRLRRDSSEDEATVQPYSPLSFPLSDEVYQQLLAETEHLRTDLGELDFTPTEGEYCGGSTTTTVEEEDLGEEGDEDPEWVVVSKEASTGSEQAPLVLKFAKR